jgi:hypothetical protein
MSEPDQPFYKLKPKDCHLLEKNIFGTALVSDKEDKKY